MGPDPCCVDRLWTGSGWKVAGSVKVDPVVGGNRIGVAMWGRELARQCMERGWFGIAWRGTVR